MTVFKQVLNRIREEYPYISLDMLVDEKTMAPIIVFRYNGIEVREMCFGIDIRENDDEKYWVDKLYGALRPIIREIKLEKLIQK